MSAQDPALAELMRLVNPARPGARYTFSIFRPPHFGESTSPPRAVGRAMREVIFAWRDLGFRPGIAPGHDERNLPVRHPPRVKFHKLE